MNQGPTSNPWLLIGGLISLAVHLAGGLAVIGSSAGAPGSGDAPKSSMLDASENPPEPTLGMQDSTSVSINWLGFAEATPQQQGEISDTEQPALSMAPVGEPSEQRAAQPRRSEAQDAASKRAPVGPAQGEALTAASPPSPQELEPAPSLAIAPRESANTVPAGEGALRLNAWGLPPAPEQVQAPPSGGSPRESPQQQDQGKGEQDTTEEGAQAGADDIAGLPSDRESVATALKEAVDLDDWSKPLARKGLEIKTVRPRWRTTTLLTRLPRNPVVMISFGKDGRVVKAEFIRHEGRTLHTGSREVDEPLLDAVYKWRATGKELEQLKDGDTVSFAIRIVLRR